MFQNSNKEVLKELARDNYLSHKSRNRIAILAIALTTLLITAVWTVGISFISTMGNYGESSPGPGCEGSITGTVKTRDMARELPQVTWADLAWDCSKAALHNEEFAGMNVRLLAPEMSYYEHNFVELTEGRFAQAANEIVISDTMAKRLRLEKIVGESLELLVMIGMDEEMTETPIRFTITGYYENPLINISEIYDEIYTAQEFIRKYNPIMEEQNQNIYVKLNNLNPLLMKTDVMDKLQEVSDLTGGIGVGTKHTNSLGSMLYSVIPALLFVAFIGLSGYFLIYNVFYISISADIRWFGMMKTIGTTGKQLKRVLMQQIRRLAAIGIVIGIILGYLVGNRIGPGVMERTIYGMFYQAPNVWVVCVLGAFFSWFTVYISALKSLKLACSISPVEAARFAPKKKKNFFTILSFALSGMIFLVSCNATLGFSVDHMVERYNMKDARIFHQGANWMLEEAYQPISQNLPEEIHALPFVTNVDVMYRARTMPDYQDFVHGRMYTESRAEVYCEGAVEEELDYCANNKTFLFEYGNGIQKELSERGNRMLPVLGLPARLLEQELEYAEYKGNPDVEKFAAGEGIIWQSMDLNGVLGQDFEHSVQPGDMAILGFYDDEGNYVHKELPVLAVIQGMNIYGTDDIGPSNIIMSDTAFKEIYPNYEERISNIQIETEKEITKQEHQQLEILLKKEHSTQLQLDSRYSTRTQMSDQKDTFQLIGFLLAGLLGIIGISNMINTITSDVFARKIELAAMQSIGMTKKQLWSMLLTDTLKFTGISVVFMLALGGGMSYMVTQSPLFTGFNAGIFIISAIVLLLLVIAICVFMTGVLVRVLNRKSIVERLREIE